MLKMSIWNYLKLNTTGEIRNIFENDTECENDNVRKFWGKKEWKLMDAETFRRLVWAVSNMGNARKMYVNIERLSSGDIIALLDSIVSDDKGDIENIMKYYDTEFVAEDESVISTNIIRKEEIGDQSSSVSVPEVSIHILPTQKAGETDTLGHDERNSASATQRSSNQSPSPANQCIGNQSPAAATQCASNQSPAAATQCTMDQAQISVVTRRTSDQSSKTTTPPPTVALPKNTKKRKQNSVIKDKT